MTSSPKHGLSPSANLFISSNLDHILAAIQQLVSIESPSEDPAAVNRAADLVEQWAKQLGSTAKRHKQKHFGDILELRFGRKTRRKPILILGHLDTVWPIGTLAHMPCKLQKGKLLGPGTLDMKAGVVMALSAIAQCKALKQQVILLLVSDEEVGSPVSRPITERIASTCEKVFVLEPAQMPGAAYKTQRKGIGHYKLHVQGISSHSGVDFEKGHSAILELSNLLLQVAQFTDLSRGLTVNPGVIQGGTRSNVVAAEAWAEIDVRIARASDAKRIEKLFESLRCKDKACKLTVTGGINRPPMERRPGTIALYRQAKDLAAKLGFDLPEAATGGGSDGNFTAALGIPTLDGMGAVGEGAHAAHEHIEIAQILPRINLLAQMLQA